MYLNDHIILQYPGNGGFYRMVKRIIVCPTCKKKYHLEGKVGEKIVVSCDSCDFRGNYTIKRKQRTSKKDKTNESDLYKKGKTKKSGLYKILTIPPNIIALISGVAIIFIGAVLLYTALFENLRVGIILILIGTFTFFFVSEKKRIKNKLLVSEKITIICAIWLLFSILIATNLDITSFFLLVFIGFLVLKELTTSYTKGMLDMKMKIIILGFFAVYVGMIINEIIPYFIHQ
jgi:hypothetical protein